MAQSEAEHVLHALAGWPQCWACLDFQRPVLARMTHMARHGLAQCLCTACRKEKVRCAACLIKKARFAMFWTELSDYNPPSDGIHDGLARVGTWFGYCTPCARSKNRWSGYHWDAKPQVSFAHYPGGLSCTIPTVRYRYDGRRRRRY